jgi:hypothetical protein
LRLKLKGSRVLVMANVGPGKRQVGVVLRDEVADWLKVEAAKSRRTLGEVVEEGLEKLMSAEASR